MDEIGRNEHIGVCCDVVAADAICFNSAARQKPTRGIEAQRFINHLACVLKLQNFVHGRRQRGQGVHFRVQLLLGFGMLGQQIPQPIERACRGLVASDDKRHYFVEELLVGHGFARFSVARRHQHR